MHADLEKREARAVSSDEAQHFALPEPSEPLRGREKELLDATELLRSQDSGVFTLMGEPGSGRTRFALELARHLAPRYPDGAAYVDLSAEDGRDTLARVVGEALGIVSAYSQNPEPLVIEFLAEKQLLLVIDPLDRLASKAHFFNLLKSRCPSLAVLAVSSVPLGLKDEQVIELPGLSDGPEGGALQFYQFELARRNLNLSLGEHGKALGLLRSLEGNALALRLAAGLQQDLGLEALANEMANPKSVIKEKDAPGVNLGLRSVFEASWRGLDERTQECFAKLSAFHPGFTFEAAKAVAGMDESMALRLETCGLLIHEGGRFSLSPSLRRLARVKLGVEAGARFKVGIAHRDYYMGFLHEHAKEFEGGDYKAGLIKVLDQDFGNFREAWRRACETDAYELLASAAASLGQYLDFRNRNREGAYLYGLAIDRMEANGRSRALAELYMQRANSLAYFGRADEGLHLMTLALDYWRSVGDAKKEAVALCHLANSAGYASDFSAQAAHAESGGQIFKSLDDVKGQAWACGQQSLGLLRQGLLKPAREAGQKSLQGYEQVNDISGSLWVMGALAEVAFKLGDVEDARALCYRQLDAARPLDSAWAQSSAYLQLASIAELQGSYREGRHFIERSRELFARMGRGPQMAFSLRNLSAQVLISLGDYGSAQDFLQQSLDPARRPESSQDLGWPMNLLAQLRMVQGDFHGAREICEQGLRDASLISDEGAWFKENLAQALLALGEGDKAIELQSLSLHLNVEAGRRRGIAWGHNRLAFMLLTQGKTAQAIENLKLARELHQELGENPGLASDDLGLARSERLDGHLEKALELAEKACSEYISFQVPRGMALAQIELGECFLARGETDLAREPYLWALRRAAGIGSLPVVCRALSRLAELDGNVDPQLAVRIQVACVNAEASEAQVKQRSRAQLGQLVKSLNSVEFAKAREQGRLLDLRAAAEIYGVKSAGE